MFKRMNALDHLHTEERRLGPAYGLWALGGVLGAHRIYLRRHWGFAQGGLFVGGVLTVIGVSQVRVDVFFPPDWVIWTALGGALAVVLAVLWALVDAFLIPRWLRRQ